MACWECADGGWGCEFDDDRNREAEEELAELREREAKLREKSESEEESEEPEEDDDASRMRSGAVVGSSSEKADIIRYVVMWMCKRIQQGKRLGHKVGEMS